MAYYIFLKILAGFQFQLHQTVTYEKDVVVFVFYSSHTVFTPVDDLQKKSVFV